jgi:hypothetical protein
MRPTGSLGASERRREASKRAGEPSGAITPGKGLEQGLHTITTTYLALAAVTPMASMLAVVVERAGRCCGVWAEKEGEGESVLRMMTRRTTDGKAGLLAKARPTKASSIEARQHSGAGTKTEYTHALQGTGREGGNSKTSVSPSSRPRDFKEATSRRCSRGGHQHETTYGEGNKHEYT